MLAWFPMKQDRTQNTAILYGFVGKRKAKVRFLSLYTTSEHGALSQVGLKINVKNSSC